MIDDQLIDLLKMLQRHLNSREFSQNSELTKETQKAVDDVVQFVKTNY